MTRRRRPVRRRRTSRRGLVAPAAGLAILAVAFAVAIAIAGLSRPRTTAATSPTARPTTAHPTTATPTAASTPSPTRHGLPRSAPVRIVIPTIKVNSGLQPLGVTADKHTMQLPPKATEAGWYQRGATPGQPGPTIVVGYIASRHGPGVFSHLADLKTGDQISLRRADGKVVTYRVDQIASYPRGHFPTSKVYTSADPTLRLITTGGTLHPGQPAGNVVVYAHQAAIR